MSSSQDKTTTQTSTDDTKAVPVKAPAVDVKNSSAKDVDKVVAVIDAGNDDNADTKKPNTTTEFKSENIGRWASKQENPFAEQNRKRQAKKEKHQAEVRKAFSPIMITLIVLAVLALIFCVVMLAISLLPKPPEPVDLPEISGDTPADIIDYRDKLQNLFNQKYSNNSESTKDFENALNDAAERERDQEKQNVMLLAQMSFYLENVKFNEAIDVGNTIKPETLTLRQKNFFYGVMAYCLYEVGREEESQEYYGLAGNTVDEILIEEGAE